MTSSQEASGKQFQWCTRNWTILQPWAPTNRLARQSNHWIHYGCTKLWQETHWLVRLSFSSRKCFLSQQFSQNSVFQPVSAKIQQAERGCFFLCTLQLTTRYACYPTMILLIAYCHRLVGNPLCEKGATRHTARRQGNLPISPAPRPYTTVLMTSSCPPHACPRTRIWAPPAASVPCHTEGHCPCERPHFLTRAMPRTSILLSWRRIWRWNSQRTMSRWTRYLSRIHLMMRSDI